MVSRTEGSAARSASCASRSRSATVCSSATAAAMRRYLEDQGFVCPYTGTHLSYNHLLADRLEIEHIIPRSLRPSDALSSCVMTFRSVNDMKGQRTAMQFICEEQGREVPGHENIQITTKKAYVDYVAKHKKQYPQKSDDRRRCERRAELMLMERYDQRNADFTERDLTQTSHLNKMAIRLVKQRIGIDAKHLPGNVTAFIRQKLHIDECLFNAVPRLQTAAKGQPKSSKRKKKAEEAPVEPIQDDMPPRKLTKAEQRAIEAEIEGIRESHYAAGDAVHAAQGAYYEANAAVSRIEGEIRLVSQTQGQLRERLDSVQSQAQRAQLQQDQARADLESTRTQLDEARRRAEELSAIAAAAADEFPLIETSAQQARERADEARALATRTRQAIELSSVHTRRAGEALANARRRRDRLHDEAGALQDFAPEELEGKSPPKYRKDIPVHRLYFHEIAAPDKISYRMRQIVQWMNDPETKRGMHPVRLAAKAHYQMLHVYPFPRHSGKVARLVMNLILLRNGFPPVVIHATERQRYYDALKTGDNATAVLIQEALAASIESTIRFYEEAAAQVTSA